MNKIHNPNDYFKKTIQEDNPGIIPHDRIEQRLHYYFNLKHSRNKIHSNSFLGFPNWIFSNQSLLLKTSFVVLFLLPFFIKSPVIENNINTTCDSCYNNCLVDTNFVAKDTSFY